MPVNAPQQIRWIPQQTVPYEAGNTVSRALTRAGLLRELHLTLAGQLTVAAAANLAADLHAGDEWGAIEELEIDCNNGEDIRSLSGESLWWLNRHLYGTYPRRTFALGDGATLNPSFSSTLILPFWHPKAVKPIDTALPTNNLTSLDLRVKWRAHTGLIAAATGWTVNPSLTVNGLYSYGITGEFAGTRWFRAQNPTYGAAVDKARIELPLGQMYRGFLINTQNATPADATGLLTSARLFAGSTTYGEWTEAQLRDVERLRSGYSDSFAHAAVGYDRPKRSTKAVEDAWLFLDLVSDGYQKEAIDSAGLSELVLEVKTSAAATLNIWALQLLPNRQKAQAAA